MTTAALPSAPRLSISHTFFFFHPSTPAAQPLVEFPLDAFLPRRLWKRAIIEARKFPRLDLRRSSRVTFDR